MRAPPSSGRHRRQPRSREERKTASQGVDVLRNRAKMCGSPDGKGLRATTTREAGINPSQGVDESESRAKMGGSLRANGHWPPTPKHAEGGALRVLTEAKVALYWAARLGQTVTDRSLRSTLKKMPHRVLTEAKTALQCAARLGGNDGATGKALRPIPMIFDSVRR